MVQKVTAQKYALLIGNNEFDDASLSRLIAPPMDIQQLGELLSDAEIGSFSDVTTLLNQPYPAVRRAIARFFTHRKRDDLLVLYFSGHGILDENGNLYLAVKDTERDLLNATAIEASFITNVMDRSMSNRQVLVLDCCQSGAFGRSKGVIGASVGTASVFEGTGYGRVVLTATDATQYAWDGENLLGEAQNSVFTRYLVQGLRTGEADADADGLITLDELYDYVYENVVAETPRQTPAKWSYRQQGTIVLARNPRPMLKPAPLPPELVQAIESPLAGVREGAVKDLQYLLSGSDRSLALSSRLALQKLTEDDSRRVSIAAQAALQNVELPLPIPAPQIETIPADATPEILAETIPDVIPPKPLDTAPVVDTTVVTPAEQQPVPAAQPVTGLVVAHPIWRPVVILFLGWSLGWVLAVIFAMAFQSFYVLQATMPVAGFITGYLLANGKRMTRLISAGILAVIWSLPIFVGLVYSFYNIWTTYILTVPTIALAGLVSILLLIYFQSPHGLLKTKP